MRTRDSSAIRDAELERRRLREFALPKHNYPHQMSSRVANEPPRSGWRILAAFVAAVAIVSLVHWHPLFEDSGSETLRNAANQCAACAAGNSALPVLATAPLVMVVVARLSDGLELRIFAAPAFARSAPRAPPC